MIIEIKEKEYELKFGIKFVRELDKQHSTIHNGLRFGVGLDYILPLFFTGDVVTLSEILYTATCTEKKRPTHDEIDAFVEEYEDLEKLFDEVADELKKQNATKKKAVAMEKNLQAQK